VIGVRSLPLSTIFIFRIVPVVRYFLFFILCDYEMTNSNTVVFCYEPYKD